MPEAIALQVVVFHFADAFDAQRLPRQIFSGAPTALAPGHPCGLSAAGVGPIAPRMMIESVLAERFKLDSQIPPARHRECRRDADVMQGATVVVQAEEERSDQRVLSLLVPPKSSHHTVGRPRVLDLDHRALARLVGSGLRLRNHAIEARSFELLEPVRGNRRVARHRRQVNRRRHVRKRCFEDRPAL